MVVLLVDPLVVTRPGYRVRVHVPVGRPLRTTLPVPTVQVGWVMVPKTGAVGVGGWASMVTLADEADVQPSAFLTVNVKVPADKPETVVEVPKPVVVIAPGFRVRVHSPEPGNPVS